MNLSERVRPLPNFYSVSVVDGKKSMLPTLLFLLLASLAAAVVLPCCTLSEGLY